MFLAVFTGACSLEELQPVYERGWEAALAIYVAPPTPTPPPGPGGGAATALDQTQAVLATRLLENISSRPLKLREIFYK